MPTSLDENELRAMKEFCGGRVTRALLVSPHVARATCLGGGWKTETFLGRHVAEGVLWAFGSGYQYDPPRLITWADAAAAVQAAPPHLIAAFHEARAVEDHDMANREIAAANRIYDALIAAAKTRPVPDNGEQMHLF